jgi:hypothetical protein
MFGLVLHSHDYDNGPNGTLDTTGLKPDASMNIMRKGRAYVYTEDSATEGNAAFVRYTTNGSLTPGGIRHDGDSSKADKCEGIVFRSTRTDAGLVLVDVDMEAYDALHV